MSTPHPNDRLNRSPNANGSQRATNGPDADIIRSRMASVRSELQRDAQRVSSSVKQASNWEFYVRNFPFACAGLALVVGYSLIPASRRSTVVATDKQIKQLADAGKLHVVSDPPRRQEAGIASKAMLALGSIAARAAMDYVSKQLGEQTKRATHSPE